MRSYRKWWQGSVLVGLGTLQMVGDVLALPSVKGLGAWSHVSPAPKVFTTQQGYETYSPRFYVSAQDDAGRWHRVALSPAVNARVRGPYNRRNAYGAVLSYGPVLVADPRTQPMFEHALLFGFCDAKIASEIGLNASARYRIDIVPRAGAALSAFTRRFDVQCDQRRVTYAQSSKTVAEDL